MIIGLAETLSPATTTNPKPALFRYTPSLTWVCPRSFPGQIRPARHLATPAISSRMATPEQSRG